LPRGLQKDGRSDGGPGSSNGLFGVGGSTGTAYGVASVVRDYTREYTSVGYIIRVRRRLFSPSSPGVSFFLVISNQLLVLSSLVGGDVLVPERSLVTGVE
jgi:hypothetical protein